MKKLILILLMVPVIALGQWRKSNGKLVPYDSTVTVKITNLEVDGTANGLSMQIPQWNLLVLPREPYPNLTAVGFGVSDTGKIYVQRFFLQDSAKFVGAGVAGGTVATATYRTFAIALYDSANNIISQTETGDHPGNNGGALVGFRGYPLSGTQDTVELARGFYSVAFTTFTNQNTHNYRGPDISVNSFAPVFFSSGMVGGKAWFGEAANRAVTNGAGVLTFPAALGSLTKPTTTWNKLPWIVLQPLNIGPSAQ